MQPGTFIFPVRREAFAKTVGLPVWPAQANNPKEMARLYTAMHRNILDVFNEHGVQIMTPAYEGDPEIPKVVPRDQWYLEPAAPTQAPDDEGRGP